MILRKMCTWKIKNETPPRGLSSRGRRVRTLEQLGNEEIVLAEIALEVVEEEEDEDI